MQLQLIRNATLKLRYGGKTILIDPDFGEKHSRPSFTQRSPNPMVDIPISIEEILQDVDLVFVSHLHADHFDAVAQGAIPKHLPLLCQPGDEDKIRAHGFQDVTPLTAPLEVDGLVLTPRPGSHGRGAVLDKMGNVIGLTLEASGEPSLYWAGDTVLIPAVLETTENFQPDVIVTHSCGAKWDGVLIVMDADETVALARSAPTATTIAVHMEALDHATVDRQSLRYAATAAGLDDSRLLIPLDGEILSL